MKILITDSQLKEIAIPYFKYNEYENHKNIQEVREKWNSLTKEEKILVLEIYKLFNPKKTKLINEGFMDWIQTGLDIGGIFDPTGIADAINAVIYFGRGEVLFGILSLVSIVPYVGDAIGKPLVLAAKAGGKEIKLFSKALKTKNATTIANVTNSIKGTSVGNKLVKLLEGFGNGTIGKKIISILEKGKKIPIIGKFFDAILGWINVLSKAGKELTIPTKRVFIGGTKGLMASERVVWRDVIKQMFDGKKLTTFRELSKVGKLPNTSIVNWVKNVMRVPETRKLMGKTKLFLKFLDSLGVANFIGPEELSEISPGWENKMADYMKTEEGQNALMEDFGTVGSDMPCQGGDCIGSPQYSTVSASPWFKELATTPESQSILTQFFNSLAK